LRLPFTKPPEPRYRSFIAPGVAIASVLGLAAAATLAVRTVRSRRAAESHVPPTGTAGSTPDKPAGTELHPPNQNFSRQGPGGAPGGSAKTLKAQSPATGQPPAGAGPGQKGIPTPKR